MQEVIRRHGYSSCRPIYEFDRVLCSAGVCPYGVRDFVLTGDRLPREIIVVGGVTMNSWIPRFAAVLLAVVLGLTVTSAVAAPTPKSPGVVMPRMSFKRAQYFKTHPTEWASFVASLQRPAAKPARYVPATPTAAGAWQAVTTAPSGDLCNPMLLMDATVLVHRCNTPTWYRLTPDNTGNYATGTWTTLASMPVIGGTQYQPQYAASGVLPDGRVLIMGGEYNGAGEVWTNLGAIYDPVANTWTPVAAPAGAAWSLIGDAQSVVLADGTFMLASCCANPAATALFNATTLTWSPTGSPTAGQNYQDEQGYSLLPNGNVLTLDIWTNYPSGDATNAEQYTPFSGTWSSAGNTPVSLVDPYQCGNYEIGPMLLRGDRTLVAFGGNTGCKNVPATDPTAIYDASGGTWIAGPSIPKVCGSGGTTKCSLADAPAALLPTGNILFAASHGYAQSPTHFFEFTRNNKIIQVADPLFFAGGNSDYYYNFLVLPTGQILETDFSNTPELYTAAGTVLANLAPTISSLSKNNLVPGRTYTVNGIGLNGRSQGSAYGDDVGDASNYPIVKIVNTASGHVTFGRTYNVTTMSVAPDAAGSAQFVLPAGTELGVSTLYVVANGIPSKGKNVTVKAP